MFKPVTIATVALLLSHATNQKDRHTGRFGGLAVSVTALQIAEAKKITNQHYVAVFATIKSAGKKAACASFVTRLKGTYDLEYSEGVLGFVATRPELPKPPEVSQMLPGEEARLIRARSVVQVYPGPPFQSGPTRTHGLQNVPAT
jgi:hypothetical protein